MSLAGLPDATPAFRMTGRPARSVWFAVALGLGLSYLVISLVGGSLAGHAATTAGLKSWRMAAWLISGVAFLAQIVFERVRLLNRPTAAALHAALAAAIGGLLLAVAATINKMASGSVDARYVVALVAWPLITGVAAFVVALALSLIIRPRM
jgi:hypothetical protein